MSDDPLNLGGLADGSAVESAVETRKQRSKKPVDPVAAQRAETAAKREDRLSRDPGPSTAPPPPPPEPVEDKSALLDKINAYKERFTHLKSRNKLSGKSGLDEIRDELHFIEQQLGQREGNMSVQLYLLAMSGLEEGTKYYNPLSLNLTGLGSVARDNVASVEPLLDELFIKYATNMYVGPEMRLAMATATLVYTVHSANSGNPAVAKAMEAMSKGLVPQKTDL